MQKEFIADLKKSFEQGFLSDTVKAGGHTWYMQTLNGLETIWRDRYVDFSVSASFVSSQKVPTLAISIKSIDGVPVSDVFGEFTKVEDGAVIPRPVNIREDDFNRVEFKAAEELRKFLEHDVPDGVIDDLWMAYNTLMAKSRGVLKEVAKKNDDSFRGADPTK